MSIESSAKFTVDTELCIGCSSCVKVCPGGVLELNNNKQPRLLPFDEYGWNGCWKCDHCLAVCPTGAISIFGHNPNQSLPAPNPEQAAPIMDAVISNRHTCRRYKKKNVDRKMVSDLIDKLALAPNGGNKQQVEFVLIDDKDQMERFRSLATKAIEELVEQDIYPEGFDKSSYNDMKRWRETVRPDMLFCGAPHLLIPHASLKQGEPIPDVNIATAYFELLCASRGLGVSILTFPLAALKNAPEVWKQLGIPDNHYVGSVIGFGYPQITYVRGAQRRINASRISRPSF